MFAWLKRLFKRQETNNTGTQSYTGGGGGSNYSDNLQSDPTPYVAAAYFYLSRPSPRIPTKQEKEDLVASLKALADQREQERLAKMSPLERELEKKTHELNLITMKAMYGLK